MIESDLAVIIVNYNTGDYLERCLRSLEEHRGDLELDVVVIDNASEDGSHRRATAAHPWARLIREPRERLPLARLEPGHPRNERPLRPAAESRCRMVEGDAH